MEREWIVERTRAGLAAAREQGRIGGRRRVMTEEVVERSRRMLENGATRQQVADVVGGGTQKHLQISSSWHPQKKQSVISVIKIDR